MAGIVHLGVGLAAKPLAPKVPAWVLLVAAELIDLLWGVFTLAKIEDMGNSPWSHGLFMSAVWSTAAGLGAGRVYRSRRAGVVIGLLVFSHWLIDFISHPMTGGPADLPLLFSGSPKVGLGVYSTLPRAVTVVIEIGSVLAGLAVYWRTRKQAPAELQRV